MTPSHDAPETGPSSFDDGPAPSTLGLSRREIRAAERARAQALGLDEAADAPSDETSATEANSERAADSPSNASEEATGGSAGPRASEQTSDDATGVPGVGADTSAILLSGGVLTRRQLRAIREAEEAARQQRGSEHGDSPAAAAPTEEARRSTTHQSDTAGEAPAEGTSASEPAVPPYVRYGRGARATPRPRTPYGGAYRRPAVGEDAESGTGPVRTPGEAPASDSSTPASAGTTSAAAPSTGPASAETPSAWPFAPIVPSPDGDREVDASGEQPTVPPLASHVSDTEEERRGPATNSEPEAVPRIEPAFGTRSVTGEETDGVDDREPGRDSAPASAASPSPSTTRTDADSADTRVPFTPPAGHWSVQDQVDENQPHTGNHFILPTVPHPNDMQQALNSTGEIIITGSIDLPRSLGSMGTHPDRFDTADMDRMLEQGDDHDNRSSDSEPVRASRAVSTHTSTRAVVQPPPRKRFTAPVVAAVTAGGIAVIGAGLVIIAFMTNVF